MNDAMNFKKALPVILILLYPFAVSYGAYSTADNDDKTSETGVNITRTAAELGILVPDKTAYSDTVPTPEPIADPPQAVDNSMPMGSLLGYLGIAYNTICAQLADSGALPWTPAAPGFDQISQNVMTMVTNSRYSPGIAGQQSLLKNAGFIRELEDITGASFSSVGTARFLVNGPASFKVKDRLMREAKKTIYVTTYAIYDDTTGSETTNILLAKKAEGVDIKIIVDKTMSRIFGGKLLDTMAKAGIEVIRYEDTERINDILHVKMLIVDGNYAVIGGMNYGDPYSHKGNGLKWRDTDIVYTGPAVLESLKIFAGMWNAKITGDQRQVTVPRTTAINSGSARIAVLHHNPPTLSPKILISIVKAMYGATRRINIENAYIVAIPAVIQAVAEARQRGIEVNILTNSKESIDSDGKNMADVIYDSAKLFAATGANVYLKQGQTLHSKFMTVDGVFCNIGSYNLHPRSERYDTELNINLIDPGSVATIDAAFARDIAEARKITAADMRQNNPSWLSNLLGKYFFSHLAPGQ